MYTTPCTYGDDNATLWSHRRYTEELAKGGNRVAIIKTAATGFTLSN
jgi:hypothetical protein